MSRDSYLNKLGLGAGDARVVNVYGNYFAEEVHRLGALLAVPDPRGLEAAEWEVHLATQGWRVDVDHARFDGVHVLERAGQVFSIY